MPVAIMENVEKKFNVPLIELWGMTEIAGLGSTSSLWKKQTWINWLCFTVL